MFVEPHFGNRDQKVGWIEVISGCMFSGKTEELIRRLNRALIAQQSVEIFKPKVDTRYHPNHIISHNEREIPSTPIQFASEILSLTGNCEVIGIDEAQFFDEEIVDVCNELANRGKRVIVAGLDMDFEGKPFGAMPNLMAIAEFVTKLHAICAQTGELASYSFRLSEASEQIKLGEKNLYEARSRSSFIKAMKGQNKNRRE